MKMRSCEYFTMARSTLFRMRRFPRRHMAGSSVREARSVMMMSPRGREAGLRVFLYILLDTDKSDSPISGPGDIRLYIKIRPPQWSGTVPFPVMVIRDVDTSREGRRLSFGNIAWTVKHDQRARARYQRGLW